MCVHMCACVFVSLCVQLLAGPLSAPGRVQPERARVPCPPVSPALVCVSPVTTGEVRGVASLRSLVPGEPAVATDADVCLWAAAAQFVRDIVRSAADGTAALPTCGEGRARVLVPLHIHACVEATPRFDFLRSPPPAGPPPAT